MTGIYRASVYTNQKDHWRFNLLSEVYPDGTFELLPILETSEPLLIDECRKKARKYLRTYGDIPSWHRPGKSIVEFMKFKPEVAKWVVHDDPDLHTLMAYGDIRMRRDGTKSIRGAGLFSMQSGDWIMFIAHLAFAKKPGEPDAKHERTGWYLVGCLRATCVEFAGAGQQFSDRTRGHAHWLWGQLEDHSWGTEPHNMIICGDPGRKDQRFERAVPVLTRADALRLIRDKHGTPVDPNEGNQTVKSCIGSYTRTGRRIADCSVKSDAPYLRRLRAAILDRNPSLSDLLW